MQTARLEFWFEFASTYSYVAAMRIEALCAEAEVDLAWRPFLLGPIFGLQGWNDSHFNLNPRRGDYMWRDMERLTSKFGLPWQRPSLFPRPTTLPARVACAITGEPWCGDYIRRVFVANFGENREIGDASTVASILTELGQNAAEILTRAIDPSHRGILRANTDRAVELGIFGAPNCVVDGELFWGEETLDDAIAWARRGAACLPLAAQRGDDFVWEHFVAEPRPNAALPVAGAIDTASPICAVQPDSPRVTLIVPRKAGPNVARLTQIPTRTPARGFDAGDKSASAASQAIGLHRPCSAISGTVASRRARQATGWALAHSASYARAQR